MKITLLSSVHVLGYRSLILYMHGMHCFQCGISKFYAIHMTSDLFGQNWYRYQKGIKCLAL